MKLEEIYLGEDDTQKLSELLKIYNSGLPRENQKTYQEYAEELLTDAIYLKWAEKTRKQGK